MHACSTTHLFHYFFSDDTAAVESILARGLRPLSDFPESERWQQLEEEVPGFYPRLYEMIAQRVLQRPYTNSGVFITPIDFRVVDGTHLSDKPRFRIPVERLVADESVITYVIDDERISLPFTEGNLKSTAETWDVDMVRAWFGLDQTKVFFYVPQVAAYQGQIPVSEADFESFDS